MNSFFTKPIAFVLLILLATTGLAQPGTDGGEIPWREEYAYAMGVAYLPYLFPYYKMAASRYNYTMVKKEGDHFPYAPVNQFWHQRQLTNHENKDGTGPSNDTIYSVSWVSVEDEPVILSHPDMGERYFTFQLSAMTSDNFGSIGARATGTGAGTFAIVPPHYQGKLPEGIKQVITAPTPWFIVVGRTLVDSDTDLLEARAFQDQYKIMPLSEWEGKGKAQRIEPWKPITPKEDPLGFWRTTARAMAENPPPASEDGMLAMMKSVGLGPDGDLDALDEDSKRGLARAFVDGMAMMREGLMSPPGETKNGWRIPPPEHGRLGTAGMFLDRGMIQSQRGFVANDPVEALYFTTSVDGDGNMLSGKDAYTVHFPVAPPAQAFWSLTVYDDHSDLIENDIGRYSRGDRSEGLQYDEDGGVTLYLQAQDPGGEKSANWLPIPDDQPFFLMLRVYNPKMQVLNGEWAPSPVVKLDRIRMGAGS